MKYTMWVTGRKADTKKVRTANNSTDSCLRYTVSCFAALWDLKVDDEVYVAGKGRFKISVTTEITYHAKQIE